MFFIIIVMKILAIYKKLKVIIKIFNRTLVNWVRIPFWIYPKRPMLLNIKKAMLCENVVMMLIIRKVSFLFKFKQRRFRYKILFFLFTAPFGKRSWKMFYCTLRDLVLYLHKDEHGFRKSQVSFFIYNQFKQDI